MGWFRGLRSLGLRSKVLVTLAGTAVVVVAVATHLSLRYWAEEAVRASEDQGLATARSVRNSIETALRSGRDGGVERALLAVTADSAVRAVRVYDRSGAILHSTVPAEVGGSTPTFWLPRTGLHAADGFVHLDESADVHVVLPMSVPPARTLELVLSTTEIHAGTRRGALLGVGLALGSILAIAGILGAMLEREVVEPIHRMERELTERTGRTHRAGDEVHELRRSLDDLIEQERTAENRAREREEMAEFGQMAAEMAHEFKRPLAAIRAALDMFDQEYRLDSGGRAVMGSVNDQLERLTGTMQDLFRLARAPEVETTRVDLRDVIDDALVEFAGQPGADRLEVVRDYAPDVQAFVEPGRLRQALTNLMMNALEAMPGGGTLTLSVRGEAADAVIDVSDTGPGVPFDLRDRIFLPFHTTKTAGTGLGLPLVARVVASLGGSIELGDAPGGGARFSIRIPRASASDRFGPPSVEREPAGSRT